jgi:death on curing protein
VGQASAMFDGAYVHGDPFAMAAAYAFHIAQNQPYVDGNKRTGVVAALTFLKVNGVEVDDPGERLEPAMRAIADRSLDKAGLASLLRELADATSR